MLYATWCEFMWLDVLLLPNFEKQNEKKMKNISNLFWKNWKQKTEENFIEGNLGEAISLSK